LPRATRSHFAMPSQFASAAALQNAKTTLNPLPGKLFALS
jgi:hypothetical protein